MKRLSVVTSLLTLLSFPWIGEGRFFISDQARSYFPALGQPAAFIQQPLAADLKDSVVFFALMHAQGIEAPRGFSPHVFTTERQEIVTYIVEEGDTPSAIAAEFGITLVTLLWANNLTERSMIRTGQELIILPVSGVRHVVRRGETVSILAKRYQVGAEDIIGFNDLPVEGDLYVGDVLIVPGGRMPPAVPRQTYPRVSPARLASDFFIAPALGRNFGRLHGFNGIDIANSCGLAIWAAAAGTVALADGAGWNGGYGKYIRIRHTNGVETLYAHLKSLAVNAGVSIGQGEYLGEMGTTGRSSGCHLHFEVRGARNPFAR